jgi:general stress protein CsbA
MMLLVRASRFRGSGVSAFALTIGGVPLTIGGVSITIGS